MSSLSSQVPEFVGDLSMQDAGVLATFGRQAAAVLEFGVGGSTMIFAQCRPMVLTSVDTDPQWIERTSVLLSGFPEATRPTFLNYGQFITLPGGQFDLIFVDGIDGLRRDFALRAWRLLPVGGVMLFHDTRRQQDFYNVIALVETVINEVSAIELNVPFEGVSSNITVVRRKAHEPYEDWNYTEGKPLSAYGK